MRTSRTTSRPIHIAAHPAASNSPSKKISGPYSAVATPATQPARRSNTRVAVEAARAQVSAPTTACASFTATTDGPTTLYTAARNSG